MTEPESLDERYILYLDILGFKEALKTWSPDQIYDIVNKSLVASDILDESMPFSVLYFSDTRITYQNRAIDPGVDEKVLDTLTKIAEHVYLNLTAQRIPVRGVISSGQFVVQPDKSGKHNIFFGDALISAYNLEPKFKWLGIVADWKVTRQHRLVVDDEVSKNAHIWVEGKGYWFLNPWRHLY